MLAVDIGNSRTKFGVFTDGELRQKFSIDTYADDLVGAIEGRLDSGFKAAVVCSVVPEAAQRLERLLKHGFKVDPIWVTSETDVGLSVRQTPRASLGTDRLVNAFAASEMYGAPVIVCSFGTATTIDFVNSDRELVGGLIAPGMKLMATALREHTAKLPEIDEGVALSLGATTEDAIRAGISLSAAGLVEAAVSRIAAEQGDIQVIATGGDAENLARLSDRIDVVDPDLTLEGLRRIAERLSTQKV